MLSRPPWIIGSRQCSHRRRTAAVAAHMELLGLCVLLAVGTLADFQHLNDSPIRNQLVALGNRATGNKANRTCLYKKIMT
jgi:hypothetical protein